MTNIDLPMDAIQQFCQQWDIIEMALFGSVVRDDFNDDSDIDVLVRFREGIKHTLFDLVEMEAALKNIFGRDVDLLSRRGVEDSPNYIRRRAILDSAQVIYAE